MPKARSRAVRAKKPRSSEASPKDDVIVHAPAPAIAVLEDLATAAAGDELARLEAGWDELLA